jgi:hypothetical protein
LPPRPARAPDEPDAIAADALGLNGTLEDGSQEVERVADGDRAGSGREAIRLPARDSLRPQLPQRDAPKTR